MSSLVWLVVGAGPIVVLIALYLLLLRRVQHYRKSLSDRLDQLGHRLHEQLSEQGLESNQEKSHVTKDILEALRESEDPLRSVESPSISSIHPLHDSIADLSKRISKLESSSASQPDPQPLNLATLAVIYVRAHVYEVIRVKQIANELGVSASKLYSCLKDGLGCSAHELITLIKMQEAKKLLGADDLLVKEVAARLGFWSPYHFSSRFKDFFGLSPNQFKEHYHNRKNYQVGKFASVNSPKATQIANKPDDPPEPHIEQPKNKKTHEDKKANELSSGTAIDRFLIVNAIGYGGMGVVYKAYDPKLNRGVALKLIRAEHAKSTHSQNRLLREAQALARLSHPNVLHVYDVGTYGEQVFMAMALVEGQTLKEWLTAHKRSINEILRVMLAAGRGLSAAHKAGLVHRDFKPSNVIVGKDDQVRVLDFGLARAVSTDGSDKHPDHIPQDPQTNPMDTKPDSSSSANLLLTPLTHAGHILGTPLYMAPEQHVSLETDERTDLFSFCVVLYEALYGKRPYQAKTIESLRHEIIQENLDTPPADTDVPAWLWQIIQKGLRANPHHRYPDMDTLLDELLLDPEQAQQQKRLHRIRNLLVVALIILTIGLPIGVWYGLRYRTVQLCKDARTEIEGVWDATTKRTVQKSFLGTGRSYARGTWTRVERVIDTYLSEWLQMRSDVCDARLLLATQSEDLFDQRMNCLRARNKELRALVRVFAKADAEVVQKAIQASSALTDIGSCSEEKVLHAAHPPPLSEQNNAQVIAIREKLIAVEALQKTGKYRAGLVLAEKIANEIKEIKNLPIQAQTQFVLGQLYENTGKHEKAEKHLYDAIQAASESGDNTLAAKAMTLLVSVVGYQQVRHKEGLALGRATQVVLRLSGNNKTVQANLHNQLGGVLWSKGDYDKALEHYLRSMAIREKHLTLEHPDTAKILTNIGMVLDDQGQQQNALNYLRRSLAINEKALGSEHPDIALTLNNIGIVLRKNAEYTKALEVHQRALAIRKKALGAEHRYLATSLHNIGLLYIDRGEFAKAFDYFTKASSIWTKALGPKHPYVAHPLNGMGLGYQGLGEEQKALEYYRKALAIWESAMGTEHPLIAQSLGGIGSVFVNLGRPQQALEPLERALTICVQKTCNPASHGLILFTFARAVWESNQNKEKAIKLANQALTVYKKISKRFEKERSQVYTWLQDRDLRKPKNRSTNNDL